ncbi:hypothetical protein ACS73_00425 [Pseudomonas lini]|nr:hypothetical protein ACS73_00425 [Pseudomonas lini]
MILCGASAGKYRYQILRIASTERKFPILPFHILMKCISKAGICRAILVRPFLPQTINAFDRLFVLGKILVTRSELDVGVVSPVDFPCKATQRHKHPVRGIHRDQQFSQAVFCRGLMNYVNQFRVLYQIDPAVITVTIYGDVCRLERPSLIACRVVILFHFGFYCLTHYHIDLQVINAPKLAQSQSLGLQAKDWGILN